MKFGLRTPSIKKSVSARTTGKINRSIKKATTPFYGKKGMGAIKSPKKSMYNKTYHKTSYSVSDLTRNKSTHKSQSSKSVSYTGGSSGFQMPASAPHSQQNELEPLTVSQESRKKRKLSKGDVGYIIAIIIVMILSVILIFLSRNFFHLDTILMGIFLAGLGIVIFLACIFGLISRFAG